MSSEIAVYNTIPEEIWRVILLESTGGKVGPTSFRLMQVCVLFRKIILGEVLRELRCSFLEVGQIFQISLTDLKKNPIETVTVVPPQDHFLEMVKDAVDTSHALVLQKVVSKSKAPFDIFGQVEGGFQFLFSPKIYAVFKDALKFYQDSCKEIEDISPTSSNLKLLESCQYNHHLDLVCLDILQHTNGALKGLKPNSRMPMVRAWNVDQLISISQFYSRFQQNSLAYITLRSAAWRLEPFSPNDKPINLLYLSKAALHVADRYLELGFPLQAADYALRAYTICAGINIESKKLQQAKLLIRIGQLFDRLGDQTRLEEIAKQLLILAENDPDLKNRCGLLSEASFFYNILGDEQRWSELQQKASSLGDSFSYHGFGLVDFGSVDLPYRVQNTKNS